MSFCFLFFYKISWIEFFGGVMILLIRLKLIWLILDFVFEGGDIGKLKCWRKMLIFDFLGLDKSRSVY